MGTAKPGGTVVGGWVAVKELSATAIWQHVDDNALGGQAGAMSSGYAAAAPFPHAVIDGFLPEPLLAALSAEFPAAADMSIQFAAKLQLKSAEDRWTRMGPVTRTVLGALNAGTFVDELETLTGEPPLVADPHLEGGGQHQSVRGGKLGVHADFNRSERLGLERRINVLLYLTPSWQERWGGHLELWDAAMTTCVKRIAPLYGRCVIFTTTATSFHGVPDPLDCPKDVTRRSLALYYYATGLAEPASPVHKAQFRQRPGTSDPAISVRAEEGFSAGRVGQALLPPILYGPARALYRRARGAGPGPPS